MKKIIVSIVLGTLTILTGATYIALQPGEIISPEDIKLIEFDPADVVFIKENAELVTTTDQFGNTVKIGLRVPMKYNFPVATTTATTTKYIIEEVEKDMEMNFGAYNMCRQKGGTKNQCLKELRDDINSNIETFQINVKRELEELKQQAYQEEIEF